MSTRRSTGNDRRLPTLTGIDGHVIVHGVPECLAKATYTTEDDAKRRTGNFAYRCIGCGFWHTTSHQLRRNRNKHRGINGRR